MKKKLDEGRKKENNRGGGKQERKVTSWCLTDKF